MSVSQHSEKENHSIEQEEFKDEKGTWLQARYVVAFGCSVFNAVFYIMRINISVAIVAIALETEMTKHNAPQYEWTSVQRSTILSSFFWGYTAMQLPFMYLARHIGSKRTVLIMTILSSTFTALFVPMAALGWWGACLARIFLGCSQAGLMSSIHQLLAQWAPIEERSRMIVFAYCGQQIGIIVALGGSGMVSSWIGWPSVFYISAALGFLMAVLWMFLIEDKPVQHRMASPRERKYIEDSLASSSEQQIHKTKLKVPWKGIFTSLPYWSLLISYSCQSWGFWTLLTGIPSYMDGVFGFDLAQNGFLSALPYLCMFITSLLFGWGADKLLKHKFCSIEVSRKVGNSIGLYGSAVMLIILSFLNSSPTIAMIVLIIAVASNGGCLIGAAANHLDLSTNFTVNLVAIANTAACIMCIIGPLIVGFIVTDNENADQWQIVFLITAALYIVGNTLFIVFGSGEEQAWNNPDWMNHSLDGETESGKEESNKKHIS